MQALTAERDRLRETLEFYANADWYDRWCSTYDGSYDEPVMPYVEYPPDGVLADAGMRAREALAQATLTRHVGTEGGEGENTNG